MRSSKNDKSMKSKIVIIGHSFTSRLGLVWALAGLDCEIVILSMVGPNPKGPGLETIKDIDLYSKYVSKVHFFGKSEEELMQALDKCKEPGQKVILIPDSDFSSCVIDEHREELEPYFHFPYIKNGGTIKDWNDKGKQKELAASVGLNVAQSVSFFTQNGKYTLPDGIRYPCFPKAQSTILGGKRGLERCDNEEQLNNLIRRMCREYDLQVMVEEYLKIEKEYAVLGFSDGDHVVIPGLVEMLVSGIYRPGITKFGRVTGLEGFEDIVLKFKEFVRKLGFVGIFDIDFYLSGGKLYFSEINLRFGGSGYAITKMGVSLPAMYVKTLLGESLDGMALAIHCDKTFTNERLCMDDWYRGYETTRQYFHYLRTADIRFLQNPEDKGPGRAYRRRFLKNWVKRTIKRGLGRLK